MEVGMKRRPKVNDELTKGRRRKTAGPKRRDAAKVAERPNSANDALKTEVTRLTRELSEAVERQNATSEILASISRSTTDTRPVFDAILDNLLRLFGTRFALVLLLRDGMLEVGGIKGDPGFEKLAEYYPLPLDDRLLPGKAILVKRALQLSPIIGNVEAPPGTQKLAVEYGYNALISVPLIREGKVVGALNTAHRDAVEFTNKQVGLIRSFADQAVIAIENARMFEEVQARTRDLSESLQQQTATADVLKVISRSAFDLQTVLDTLVESASRLCDSDEGTIWQPRQGRFVLTASSGLPSGKKQFLETISFERDSAGPGGRALSTGKTMHIHDILADPTYPFTGDTDPARTRLYVPLMRGEDAIGIFILSRRQIRPFSDKQLELVQTFADQAVIAIENVRLFDEVQARTEELAASLDDLRTAQDRLVQTEKLASLGQLTAGIAHEIKNPLNFVNNFSALSAELTDELNDALKPVAMDAKVREEVTELTGMLKDNLEKVVQHGKRADSIVKNMLLHSREGSGERRSADLNALVSESLNLAYHGARAERSDFNITLEQDLDPDAGALELYPQEITRALLNLISNGFYAATRRKAENGGRAFEPVLSAATRNLGETVEIRIRDNGTGIPPEVKEKMFNPFFTTKPTGEGTGLGLSMTHDIIVKQHGGRIDVETKPGAFTEFIITLPREKGPAIKRE
jgi:two-component system, NtrC family, sensor kinase